MATDIALEHEVQNEELWSGGQEPFKASYGKLMMWYFLVSDAFTFAGFLISYGALRFSMPTWPLPDFVFASFPFYHGHAPLIFVTFMTFVLIISSVTMVRAVQEGHHGNQKGVVFWMLLTILGGATFLGSQAYEWTTLIVHENVSITNNPFSRHMMDGVYLENAEGEPYKAGETAETFHANQGYLIEKTEAEEGGEGKWIQRAYRTNDGVTSKLEFGPKAFGALFFFITGFHGFHVFSGVLFLTIIMLNAASGLYQNRGNHYEMVEKIGLYWHFVDLVWVFVFLVFYLL